MPQLYCASKSRSMDCRVWVLRPRAEHKRSLSGGCGQRLSLGKGSRASCNRALVFSDGRMVSVSDEGEKERTDAAAGRPTPLLDRLLWT
jgi:hypothetical protein